MELIITQSLNDFNSFKKHLSISTEVLAFDHNIMVELDKQNIKYKSVEDFYTAIQYYNDSKNFKPKVENFLSKLDKNCEKIVDFPFSFSGNEHYLLSTFDNWLYLEKLIKILKNKYKKIYLYSSIKPKKLRTDIFSFSQLTSKKVNSTVSFSLENETENIIELIYNLADVYFLKDEISANEKIKNIYKIRRFFFKIKRKFYNYSNFIKNHKIKYLSKKNRIIYLIQDTPEIFYLRQYLLNYNYLNPANQLRKKIAKLKPIQLSSSLIHEELVNFLKENFFYLDKYIYLTLLSYHFEVVGRIKLFKKNFDSFIAEDKPGALLMGIGTRDVFDTLCCYVANMYKIPVIIFQHGGTKVFGLSRYEKSLEHNLKVNKTLIVQAKKDLFNLYNNKTEVIHKGSIEQYHHNKIIFKQKPNRDILYCLGPDINLSFRQLHNFYSSYKKHQQSQDVISVIASLSLKIDFKLHPQNENYSLNTYLNFFKSKKLNTAKVIYGDTVEMVSRKYKIIIIDYLSSAIKKHIFSLKIPIIFYDRDFNNIRIKDNDVLSDLKKRCYISNNINDLRELLLRYKEGNLPSKWSKDIINNYIYPIDSGDPGENIAEYIENLIKKRN